MSTVDPGLWVFAAGIDCGADCDEPFSHLQPFTLSPSPGIRSVFVGWTGDADCTDGQVTMDGDVDCTARTELAKIFSDGFEGSDVSGRSSSVSEYQTGGVRVDH